MYKKILKKDENAYQSYYQLALTNPNIELSYLKKAVAINPHYSDAWIDLSRIMIENGNYSMAKKYLENNVLIADIGTGAGFPGLPLKIYNDTLNMDLIEPTNKRCRFLQDVIDNLNLQNIKIINADIFYLR